MMVRWSDRARRMLTASGFLLAAGLAAAAVGTTTARADEPLTVGVLKFGTVNWALSAMKHHGFDRQAGVDVEILPLAGKNATHVALQAGTADMIVTDWVWVSRQRAEGEDYVFIPYSTALGALVAGPDAGIADLADLKGKRLGIAGGPLDKSWLLLQAVAEKRGLTDLAGSVEPAFGAPPLLSEQLRAGRLDAVLTFWPFAARLTANGFPKVVDVEQLAAELGAKPTPPIVGYVFSKGLAQERPTAIGGFMRALKQTNDLLRDSDAEWERLRPIMKADDEAEFIALRDAFRAGIPEHWGDKEQQAAGELYETLVAYGGSKLVGRATIFDAAVFWPGFSY